VTMSAWLIAARAPPGESGKGENTGLSVRSCVV
jgi:hypothetical protein